MTMTMTRTRRTTDPRRAERGVRGRGRIFPVSDGDEIVYAQVVFEAGGQALLVELDTPRPRLFSRPLAELEAALFEGPTEIILVRPVSDRVLERAVTEVGDGT
jgi:hypothetical protein